MYLPERVALYHPQIGRHQSKCFHPVGKETDFIIDLIQGSAMWSSQPFMWPST